MAFGHTALALRLWPALIGVGAVVVTWLWARTWFDQRVALVAAFVVAVTPWSVTLSRNALPVALIGLLVPLTLWAASWAYHRGGLKWWLVTIGLGLLDLLSGPLGWLLALTVAVLGTVRLAQRGQMWPLNRNRLIAGGTLVLGLAGAGYVAGRSLEALRQLPAALGLVPWPTPSPARCSCLTFTATTICATILAASRCSTPLSA
jgi:4-amino-4-deoxy-L-arabinose transferase-like glycosyltransferase